MLPTPPSSLPPLKRMPRVAGAAPPSSGKKRLVLRQSAAQLTATNLQRLPSWPGYTKPDINQRVFAWMDAQPESWRMSSTSSGARPSNVSTNNATNDVSTSLARLSLNTQQQPSIGKPMGASLSSTRGHFLLLNDVYLGESLSGRDEVAEEMLAILGRTVAMAPAERKRRWRDVIDAVLENSRYEFSSDGEGIWGERPRSAQGAWRWTKLTEVMREHWKSESSESESENGRDEEDEFEGAVEYVDAEY